MKGAFIRTTEFSHPSLQITQLKYYTFLLIFVAGNVILPLAVHAIPQGGKIFLPIYFFTLIAAYRFGLTMGIATALLSPMFNHILTGMPPASVLPVIIFKSAILALAASWIAHRTQKISLVHITVAVLIYQCIGGVFEWFYTGSFLAALSAFQIGFPGMLIQIVAGYILLIWLNSRFD